MYIYAQCERNIYFCYPFPPPPVCFCIALRAFKDRHLKITIVMLMMMMIIIIVVVVVVVVVNCGCFKTANFVQDLRRQYESKTHQLEQALRKQIERLQLDGLTPDGECTDLPSHPPHVPNHSGVKVLIGLPSYCFCVVDIGH